MNAPDRKTFIGGSDAAAVLGVSPWDTPLKLYLKKRGEYVPDEIDRKRERIFARGKREEPHIIDDLIELYAVKVVKRSTPEAPNYHACSAPRQYLAAEVDFEWEVTEEAVAKLATRGIEIPRELIGTVQNGECKTAHPFVAAKKFGDEGTDEIPIEYGAQAMHGLMVTGRDVTLVAVGVYVDDPILYLVRRDEETIGVMEEREVNFMEHHVRAGIPPEAVNLPDVNMLFGRATETRKEATEEVAALVSSLLTAREEAKVIKDTEDDLKFQIGKFLALDAPTVPNTTKPGKHTLAYQGVPILTITLQNTTRLDGDKIRLKFPEVAAECATTSSHFVYKKPGKGSK